MASPSRKSPHLALPLQISEGSAGQYVRLIWSQKQIQPCCHLSILAREVLHRSELRKQIDALSEGGILAVHGTVVHLVGMTVLD
jgi:hypothetical protein